MKRITKAKTIQLIKQERKNHLIADQALKTIKGGHKPEIDPMG